MDFDDENYEISDVWRWADELTVRQAALLVIGVDPASTTGSYCDDWDEHKRPRGYEAAKHALSTALRKGVIYGCHVPNFDYDINGNETFPLDGTTDVKRSTVERDSLVKWLTGRGVRDGFFFPAGIVEAPDFLDPLNPRYAPKLAAAVSAWQAVTDAGNKSPKQALEKWLREHASEFRLTDDEGNPVATAIEECSKVANWNAKGGAPKTPGE